MLTVPNSKELRHKKFRCAELARYCFDEPSGALSGYLATETEGDALEHYNGLPKGTEIVCANDGAAYGTR